MGSPLTPMGVLKASTTKLHSQSSHTHKLTCQKVLVGPCVDSQESSQGGDEPSIVV